eukprot:7029416-Heterocapsa_arctica.AAC.1
MLEGISRAIDVMIGGKRAVVIYYNFVEDCAFYALRGSSPRAHHRPRQPGSRELLAGRRRSLALSSRGARRSPQRRRPGGQASSSPGGDGA